MEELPLFNYKLELTNNHENISLNSTLNFLFWENTNSRWGNIKSKRQENNTKGKNKNCLKLDKYLSLWMVWRGVSFLPRASSDNFWNDQANLLSHLRSLSDNYDVSSLIRYHRRITSDDNTKGKFRKEKKNIFGSVCERDFQLNETLSHTKKK